MDILYGVRVLKDLTNELSTKKSDVSRLSVWDLLRRDYKESAHKLSWIPSEPSIKSGLSTVPVGLESWATEGRLSNGAQSWMNHRGLSVLGVLTSFRDNSRLGKSGKGKHRREMVWVVREDETLPRSGSEEAKTCDLASMLWKGLENKKELKLKKHKKFDIDKEGKLPMMMKGRTYEQRNVNATRKVIAPLLAAILSDGKE
jgi:exopolyphosphatase